MTDFHIIIPARFSSKRLSGKMLVDLCGQPLIQRVYENALNCGAKTINIATDDERIASAIERFGGHYCMTSASHNCGTDRLSEAAKILGFENDEIIVNIQGDEPFIPVLAVKQLVKSLQSNKIATMSTLCTLILNWEELFDPNIAKVVLDKNNCALYFSRAPIPCDRDYVLGLNDNEKQKITTGQSDNINHNVNGLAKNYFRHIGLYAYRAKTLQNYVNWGAAPIEEIEKLEQLRFLWQGEKIQVAIVNETLPGGIDTENDLKRARELYALNVRY